MDLPHAILTCVLLSLMLLLMFLCFKNAKKKFESFPFTHVVPKLAYDQLMGKIPKEVPFTSYILQVLFDSCKKYRKDGLFMTYTSRPTLFIFSEDIMKLFLKEKAAIIDKSPEYDTFKEGIGSGLITNNGQRWRIHRKIINPAFGMAKLKDKVPLFNEYALDLVKDIGKLVGKPSVDPLDALKWNYFKSVSESIFGLKQDEKHRAEILRIFSSADRVCSAITTRMIYPWLRPNFVLPFSTFGRKFRKDKKDWNNFISKIIKDMKTYVVSQETANGMMAINTDKSSFRFSKNLQHSVTYILLNQHLSDPSFTFQDLHDEVSNILAAGFDTVTYCTLWCLFMFGLHPEVQEKAFNEVQSTTGDYVTYEDICNLTYLEAVIMETLRLYPTVPIFTRNLTKDLHFGKYKFHKNITIGFIPYYSHRNPDVYPNPEKFEPERFLSKELRNSETFVPFATGGRNCIGKTFALIEMKIFLAHLLRNFRFTSLDKREDIHSCWNLTLTPSRHINMKITSRLPEESHFNKEKEEIST